MSQVDKLNYLPILFWFFIVFFLFYLFIFSYFLPLIFTGLKVRSFLFFSLLGDLVELNLLYFFFSKIYEGSYLYIFVNSMFLYFKQLLDLQYSALNLKKEAFLIN